MALMLLFSNVHFMELSAVINEEKHNFRAFGASISESDNPPPIWNNDNSVTMESRSGKIAGSEIGIAFLYEELEADSNFEITAKAIVHDFGANNQVSFGLMITDELGENYTSSNKDTNYIAVGALDQVMKGFYQNGDGDRTKLETYQQSRAPESNEEYQLSLEKSGDTYVLTVNGESQTITESDLFTDDTYVGVYVARDAQVTFEDITIIKSQQVEALTIDTSQMEKQEYLVGEDLILDGIQVKADYTDGSSAFLSPDDYIITNFDSSEPGKTAVTINYNGIEENFYVNVVSLTVTDLQVMYYPAKLDYYVGDTFDSSGLVIRATYNDGYETKDLNSSQYRFLIDGEIVEENDLLLDPGTKTVMVESTETEGVVTSFIIRVNEASLTNLDIRREPAKTSYFIGEDLDLRGISVFAKYGDGSEKRLDKDQLVVEGFDSTTEGEKSIQIKYQDVVSSFTVTVKERELLGMELTDYPQTTFHVGEAFNYDGLSVSAVYDNGDKEELSTEAYTIDASNYDQTSPGEYKIHINSSHANLSSISYPVTVREKEDVEWKMIRFGQSTSDSKNMIEELDGDIIRIIADDGAGKVTGDHDGITFYYTEIDATKDNFTLSADIKVNHYAKDPHDGQESFGIMARDAIGEPGDSTVFSSNIAAIGGYSGGTRSPNGTQLFVRTGVLSPDGDGSNGIQSVMINEEKPTADNTVNNYRLTLAKTNSGFVGQLNDGEKHTIFEPEILQVQEDTMYVGFYTARVASIDISNIELSITDVKTDSPRIEAPKEPMEPSIDFVSRTQTSDETYTLRMLANVDGFLTVKNGAETVISDERVNANQLEELEIQLEENKQSNFTIDFLPDDTQFLTNDDRIVTNFSVTMKTFEGKNGELFVSPEGSPKGDGTRGQPLDLDTAITYVQKGQKIIVQEGHYVRNSPLVIEKYNDGTEENRKVLKADPQAATRPIIDFDKQSEGVVHSGDYWHVIGIDFARSAGNTKGYTVGGNHNIIENVAVYEHGDTGLQISRTDQSNNIEDWPSHNLILNSISFDNRDPSENNADGFAAKLTVGEGNIFRGTVAHNNIDDGWDLYTKLGSGPIGSVIIEDSIAFNNGFLTDGTDGAGDKNGFKLGGEGIHVPHVIRNSVAFGNGAYGFTSNSNPGVIATNNFAFDNSKGNLDWSTYSTITEDFQLEGFLSFHRESEQPRDSYPNRLAADYNFLYDGTTSLNQSEDILPDDIKNVLKSIDNVQRDEEGRIIWGEVWDVFDTFIAEYSPPVAPEDPAEPVESEGPDDTNKDSEQENDTTDESDEKQENSLGEEPNEKTETSQESSFIEDDATAESNKELDSHTDTKDVLPDTATNIYNLVALGLVILSLGYFLFRRSKAK